MSCNKGPLLVGGPFRRPDDAGIRLLLPHLDTTMASETTTANPELHLLAGPRAGQANRRAEAADEG
jgi:hypothetical protein